MLLPALMLFSCGDTGDTTISDPVSDYDYGEIVLVDLDFELQTIEPWEGQYSSYGTNFSISNESPSSGSYCGKFFIGADGDYWTSPNNGTQTARSELQLKGTAPSNTEVYYSWDIKIDGAYQESDDWQIIGQFHDQPDPAIGETWSDYPAHSPPLAFKYRNGSLIISVYSWEINGVMELVSTPLTKDAWHKIITRVYWSTENDGFVETWLDGNLIEGPDEVTRYTARNLFNNAGNYLKIGLYRSKSILTANTVYYDNIKSGLTFESVQ